MVEGGISVLENTRGVKAFGSNRFESEYKKIKRHFIALLIWAFKNKLT